jgi:hypothetical protein
VIYSEKLLLIQNIIKRVEQSARESITHRSLTFPSELKNVRLIDEALQSIKHRWPDAYHVEKDDVQPVFLLSAGWRSGSTLLQRLICSSGEIVIWGEPLGDAAIIPRLASSLNVLSKGWPQDSYFALNLELEKFSESWIANITPPIVFLRQAHRALFNSWLAQSALKVYGKKRWGFKEVRLTIEHARYLKWIYPNARFVFIYRNLYDSYLSWRGNEWASAWPKYFSFSPIIYARHWKLLLSGFLNGYKKLDGMLIKYEDLISGKFDLTELADHVRASYIDSTVLKKRIGSPNGQQKRRKARFLTPIEKVCLSSISGNLMKKVGYGLK